MAKLAMGDLFDENGDVRQLDPALCTSSQIQAALSCVQNLLGDYARGRLRGDTIDWEDLDATYEAARSAFDDVYQLSVVRYARDSYPFEDWQFEVAQGDTKLGYEDWVMHNTEADL